MHLKDMEIPQLIRSTNESGAAPDSPCPSRPAHRLIRSSNGFVDIDFDVEIPEQIEIDPLPRLVRSTNEWCAGGVISLPLFEWNAATTSMPVRNRLLEFVALKFAFSVLKG